MDIDERSDSTDDDPVLSRSSGHDHRGDHDGHGWAAEAHARTPARAHLPLVRAADHRTRVSGLHRRHALSPTGGRIRIGCSGWNYRYWRGPAYPPGVPARRWLELYAER